MSTHHIRDQHTSQQDLAAWRSDDGHGYFICPPTVSNTNCTLTRVCAGAGGGILGGWGPGGRDVFGRCKGVPEVGLASAPVAGPAGAPAPALAAPAAVPHVPAAAVVDVSAA